MTEKLSSVLKTSNLLESAEDLQNFEKCIENLEVQADMSENMMNAINSDPVNEDEVKELVKQMCAMEAVDMDPEFAKAMTDMSKEELDKLSAKKQKNEELNFP